MRERRIHASESTVHVPEPDVHVAAEHGVLSVELGRDRAECRRRLRAGAWTRHGNVIVTHNGPLTVEQQQWSALLRAGYGAVLAATSSMREFGVKVDPPSLPQIVVPATRSRPPVTGAVLRRSRLLSRTEVHPVHQPPVLRLARATLDATSLLRRPDDVRATLCAPIQQRRLRIDELREALARLGPLPGRALVLRTLDDMQLGAQSIHELRFVRGVRRTGLPQPDRQRMCLRPDGRAYLDAWWDAYCVHVELDGLGHLLVDRWVQDLVRANELEISRSACRLRFAGHQLFEDEALVMDQVRRALIAGGWS